MILENIFYINLEKRTDRKKHVEKELKKIGWKNYTRFNAVKCKDPRVGCSMSHLKILKDARENNLDYVVILEDDVVFTRPNQFNSMLDNFFKDNIHFDVLLLAGNLIRNPNTEPINSYVHKVSKCFTTTAYIVKKHYYDRLIDNIQWGIKKLLSEPDLHIYYAIDTHWMKLQRVDTWLIFRPRTITQMEDYSDIEKRYVSYGHLMLDRD